MEIYTARSLRGAAGSWSSGYDIALTQRRSPVRIRSSPFLLVGPEPMGRPRTGLRMGRGRRERGDEHRDEGQSPQRNQRDPSRFVPQVHVVGDNKARLDRRKDDQAGNRLEPRLRVKRRGIKRIDVERCALEREVLAEVQMLVLECLDAEERDPE